MFDFPSFRPNTGDHTRYNEQFYHKLATTLINEVRLSVVFPPPDRTKCLLQFPARPHWTKCTRSVIQQSVKNLDAAVSDCPTLT